MINLILLDGNRTFKGQTSRLYYSATSSQDILVLRIIPFLVSPKVLKVNCTIDY